jgi:hypothetical protein
MNQELHTFRGENEIVVKIIAAFFVSLLASAGAKAQCSAVNDGCPHIVPHFVKFNGALKDFAAVSPGRVVSIKFVVYASSAGGTPLWQEVQNVQVDPQGHYEVMLGSAGNEGIPLDLFSSGEPRWLGVLPLIPGQDELPRVLLVSVPYALQAENAQTLGGLPPSAFAKASTSAQVGSTPGGSEAALVGVVPLNGTGNGVIPATPSGQATSLPVNTTGGTANVLPKFSGASSLVNSQIADQNGMVTLQNLGNILFADQFAGGVPAAVNACPANGCIIYAVSPNVNLNLGSFDPGAKVITIYLGPFTFTVNQITLRNGLKIIGMGGTETALQSVNGNNPVFVLPQGNYASAANVALSGFQLRGSAGNTSEDAFFLDTSSTFSSGLWYSTFDDINMAGFAGIALHIRGPNTNFGSLTQWVQFTNLVVYRTPGGANALRLEGGAFELRFVNCEFDGQATGDGTNIYLGGLAGGIGAYPWSITFEGLVSQRAATAVQIDGGLNLTFRGSHHEQLWGAYQINFTRGIRTDGVTISESSFASDVGNNAGAGYILNVTTTLASQINFTHNQMLGTPDSVVNNTNLASVSYQDNGSGGTNVPITSGITTALPSGQTINIQGSHSIGLAPSSNPVSTIQSSLGPGETVTFLASFGPVTFASGGNINLMGANSVTVNGSITFIRSDLTQGLQWTPISQWSPVR